MTRKYIRRSKATINLNWIDEEAHKIILDLWKREYDRRPSPGYPIEKGMYHAPSRRQYAFGREVRRNHGNGISPNYVSFLVDHEKAVLRVDVFNFQSNNRAKAILPLNEIPRDPCAFFERVKQNAKDNSEYWSDLGTLSFNRKSIEETWAYFLAGLDLFPKYEVERMHEMTGYDS